MKKRITISIAIIIGTSLVFGVSPSSAQLNDIAGHKYEDAIRFVAEQGIVKGYADGSYQPDRILNRAEFTKIIMTARFSQSQIDGCVGSPGFYNKSVFSDIEAGIWFEPHSCLAKKEKIINGFPDGSFKGTQPIIFAEAAKISVNSYGLRSGNAEPWYAPFIEKLSVIDAIPDTLTAISDPTQRAIKEITRGEMADIIYRLRSIEDSVSSDDGSFSIRIPENALPDGVDLSSISIKKLSGSQSPMREVNGAPMVFYDLEPDGLTFENPISFEVNTSTQANVIPIVFLISGDNFDLLPEPIIEIDQKTQLATLSGKLTHFSKLAVANIDLFRTNIETPGEQKVGGAGFFPNITIERTDQENTFQFNDASVSISILPDWAVIRGSVHDLSGALTPGAIFNLPAAGYFTGAKTHIQTSLTKFTCATETNSAVMKYQAELELDYTKTDSSGTSTGTLEGSIIFAKTEEFSCVGEVVDSSSDELTFVIDYSKKTPALQRLFDLPYSLSWQRSNPYKLYKWDKVSGEETHIAGLTLGTGNVPGYGTICDDCPALEAYMPMTEVTIGPDEDIYIIDNKLLRRIDSNTGILKTVAGSNEEVRYGDIILAIGPLAIITHLSWGNEGRYLYISDKGLTGTDQGLTRNSGAIHRYDTQSKAIEIIAGSTLIDCRENENAVACGDGGPAYSAVLYVPDNIVFDSKGNLYFTDLLLQKIRKIDAETKIITTVVGSGICYIDCPPKSKTGIGTEVYIDGLKYIFLYEDRYLVFNEVRSGYFGNPPQRAIDLETGLVGFAVEK